MVKAIIFDFYGVLATDRYMIWLHRHPQVKARHASALESLCRAQDAGLSDQDFFGSLAAIAGEPEAAVRDAFHLHGETHEPLLKYIRHLREQGLKTAILSNSPPGLQQEIAGHGLDSLFDTVVCSADVGIIKPDPRIFSLTLERLNVSPAEAVFVDDRDYNVRGAEALGITGIEYSGLPDLRRHLAALGVDRRPTAAAS